MKTVADSAALAKRYVREQGSEELETVLGETSDLGISVLLVPEVISSLNRRRFCHRRHKATPRGKKRRPENRLSGLGEFRSTRVTLSRESRAVTDSRIEPSASANAGGQRMTPPSSRSPGRKTSRFGCRNAV